MQFVGGKMTAWFQEKAQKRSDRTSFFEIIIFDVGGHFS